MSDFTNRPDVIKNRSVEISFGVLCIISKLVELRFFMLEIPIFR